MASVYINGPFRGLVHESVTALGAAAGFTAANYTRVITVNDPHQVTRHAVEALVTVEGGDVRWTCDGTTPTVTADTGLGHLANSGDDITINGHDNIKNFRAINAVAANGAAVRVTFFYK